MNEYIPRNMKYYRSLNNMTQDDLAKATGMTRASIANYETGKAEPSFDAAIQIAQELGIDLVMLTSEPPRLMDGSMRMLVSEEEFSLVQAYRDASSDEVRKIVREILNSHSTSNG